MGGERQTVPLPEFAFAVFVNAFVVPLPPCHILLIVCRKTAKRIERIKLHLQAAFSCQITRGREGPASPHPEFQIITLYLRRVRVTHRLIERPLASESRKEGGGVPYAEVEIGMRP